MQVYASGVTSRVLARGFASLPVVRVLHSGCRNNVVVECERLPTPLHSRLSWATPRPKPHITQPTCNCREQPRAKGAAAVAPSWHAGHNSIGPVTRRRDGSRRAQASFRTGAVTARASPRPRVAHTFAALTATPLRLGASHASVAGTVGSHAAPSAPTDPCQTGSCALAGSNHSRISSPSR